MPVHFHLQLGLLVSKTPSAPTASGGYSLTIPNFRKKLQEDAQQSWETYAIQEGSIQEMQSMSGTVIKLFTNITEGKFDIVQQDLVGIAASVVAEPARLSKLYLDYGYSAGFKSWNCKGKWWRPYWPTSGYVSRVMLSPKVRSKGS